MVSFQVGSTYSRSTCALTDKVAKSPGQQGADDSGFITKQINVDTMNVAVLAATDYSPKGQFKETNMEPLLTGHKPSGFLNIYLYKLWKSDASQLVPSQQIL
uniref:Capsid protein n=1 Tax=Panagrellus redivivus TaxID=6233 RepID=A0A7E4VI79_PANRE